MRTAPKRSQLRTRGVFTCWQPHRGLSAHIHDRQRAGPSCAGGPLPGPPPVGSLATVAHRGTFDLLAASRVPGSDFSAKLSGNATVRVSPAQYYVLVLANSGVGGTAADILYQFATYSAASTGAQPRARPEAYRVASRTWRPEG